MSKPLRILIVDDEPLGRDVLRLLVEAHDRAEVVGECSNGAEAITRICHGDIDVVFLDIQMPGLDGFDVVRRIGPEQMPATVFVTAFDQYAIDAFEVEAVDYVLKPVDDVRFATALERARRRCEQPVSTPEQIERLLRHVTESRTQPRWVVLKTPGRMLRVREQDIDWIEAADYCVRVHVGAASHLVRGSLETMHRQIDQHQFVRIHRSAVVNVDRIREVQPLEHRDFIVILDGGERVRVSRSRRAMLEQALGQKLC